jgi:hypothetical protein
MPSAARILTAGIYNQYSDYHKSTELVYSLQMLQDHLSGEVSLVSACMGQVLDVAGVSLGCAPLGLD